MVGKTYSQRLTKLNINSVEDLIHHYPFRYNDYSVITPILKIRPNESVTIQGKINRRELKAKINGGGPELYLHTSGGSIYIKASEVL